MVNNFETNDKPRVNNREGTTASSLQKAFARGINALPLEAYHSYSERGEYVASDRQLEEQRIQLYRSLFSLLPQPASIYFPESGMDPVPTIAMGEAVVYSMRSPGEAQGCYKELRQGLTEENPLFGFEFILKDYGPFPNLNAVCATPLAAPFADKTFDAIILNDFPPILSNHPDFWPQIDRLLKDSGVLVVEGKFHVDKDGNLSRQGTKLLEGVQHAGFREHALDRYGGILQPTYSARTSPLGIVLGITSDVLPQTKTHDQVAETIVPGISQIQQPSLMVTRDEFVRKYTAGADVAMHAYEIRVFQKRTPIGSLRSIV